MMAPFSIPVPCILPHRIPIFGGPQTIDTGTKIEIICETYLDHEIYYTLDGTKPQPYAGIVQGSKLQRYRKPFCLPPGKITIKAIALNSRIKSMQSNVVTKCIKVVASENAPASKKFGGKNTKRCNTKGQKQMGKDKVDELPLPLTQSDAACTSKEEEDCKSQHSEDTSEDSPLHSQVERSNGKDSSESEVSSAADTVWVRKEGTNEDPLVLKSEDSSLAEEILEEDNTKIECGQGDNELNSKVSKSLTCLNVSTNSCMSYAALQQCSSCQAPIPASSKFCIKCGNKLMVMCLHCKEFNSVIATFCQFCGLKIESVSENEQKITYIDSGTMAQPQSSHAFVQQSVHTMDRHSQTLHGRNIPSKSHSPNRKKLPPHSPGRGYWHQQIDYICNNIKSYAYNNAEFRASISEPMLGEFQDAQVVRGEESVTVTITFSTYTPDKA